VATEGMSPGWYPDPGGSGQLRWWDGDHWGPYAPPPTPPQVPASPPKKSHGCLWAFLVVVALIVTVAVIGAVAGPQDDKTGSSASGGSSKPAGPIGDSDELDDVTMASCGVSAGGGLIEAAGDIANNSSKTSDYSITVAYVAADGTVLESNGLAFVQNVPAAGKAKWKAVIFSEPVAGASCKITDVERTESL
jgi:hypothetical protein